MKYFCIVLAFFSMNIGMSLYNFENKSALSDWMIEDDTVMGGRSNGHLSYSEEGYAIFEGQVSLENNGGFSSMQADFATKKVAEYSKVIIKLKGDGKTYNFRVKETADQRHSYTKEFKTSGDWETIEIPLEEFTPTYRGETLDIPNYSGKTLGHVRILIGNKRNESFQLFIKEIGLE